MNATENHEKANLKHRLLTILGAGLCLLLLPILIINCLLIIKSYTDKDSVPNVGGVFPMIVLTDSMYPVIHGGDLIICRQAAPESVAVGDVICFFDPDGKGRTTVTHRVTEVVTDADGLRYVTKGDANNAADQKAVPAEKLLGVYRMRIPGIGRVSMFMQTIPGLVVCVICPLLAMLVYDRLRRRRYERARRETDDALLAELEALRAEKRSRELPQ